MTSPSLWAHQAKTIELARSARDLALFFEMGCGKTRTAIEIIREKFRARGAVYRTLILCPIIVVENWRREFLQYSKIGDSDIVCLTSSEKSRVKKCQSTILDSTTFTLTEPKILITNYEALLMPTLYEMFLLWRPEILIADESQRLKNHTTKRSIKAAALADRATHRYILTGTPILNTPMDVFGQFRVLDGGETFGNNFYGFRGRYFEDQNASMPSHIHFPKFEARRDTYSELSRLIYKKAVRVLKKDCLDLPPLVRERVYVELGVDQARMYQEMKKEFITWVQTQESSSEPRAVVAQMALTKALRLAQIVSGYVKTECGTEITLKDNPRLKALKELLEDYTPDHKVIVWATFRENYRQISNICKELKIESTELHGGVTAREKNENMDRFRQDPRVRVIVCNQQAAGIGINLVESDVMVYFSRNFSLEQDLQSESRNYRGGSEQHDKVTRIDIVAPGTIDELIMEALANKQNIAEQVLSWKGRL